MADVKKIIKDIKDKDLSGSNEQQGAFAEMIKGLAFSDDPLSNEFMKKVDKTITKVADEVLKKEESIVIIEKETELIQENGNKIILEKGDRIKVLTENNMSKYYDKVVEIIQHIFNKNNVIADADNYVHNQPDRLVVSAEDEYSYLYADYWGEYGRSPSYISEDFQDALIKYDLFAEWQDPGTLNIWKI
jgi:hypothetical protein